MIRRAEEGGTARRRARAVRAALAVAAAGMLAGCTARVLDQPDQQRHADAFWPPFYTSASSADGTSHSWSAAFWLVGEDVESQRRHVRALPFWWRYTAPPYVEQTLVFPFWYARTTEDERTRFYSILYGYTDGAEVRSDYVLPPLFYRRASRTADWWRSGLLLIYDWEHEGERDDFAVLSLLGLVTGLRAETGLPPEGVAAGALGRSHSRRLAVVDLLGLVTLFGYDDVGDRREVRALTLVSSEPVSLFRSWRGRAPDDPFVREWLFPLYMNVGDADGGWRYVGPLWGGWRDTASSSETDWWAAGLVARTRDPAGTTWRVLGIPVAWPD